MEMLKRIDIDVYSTRLDKYYNYPRISESFSDSRVYIIPKKILLLRVPRSGSER
jgi:hypothetical protein